MRKYEICMIINPDVDDRQVNALIEKALVRFKNDGGIVDSTEVAGRRRLSYEIQKKPEGIYVFLKVTAEPAVVKELDRQFTLNEQIMRTKVFRDDAKKKPRIEQKPEIRLDTKPAGRGDRPSGPRGDRPSGPRPPRVDAK